jgi:hypothetical protein
VELFFPQTFNYTTLEIWIKKEEEEEALLHSMQIIIQLKEMDETKITLSTRHKKNSQQFAHGLDVHSCEQF